MGGHFLRVTTLDTIAPHLRALFSSPNLTRRQHPRPSLAFPTRTSSPRMLTFATEDGNTFNVDVDLSMELENVMALLEAEVRVGFDSE